MKRNNSILLVLFLGTLMGALDISIVGPALPAISRSLGLRENQLSWIFSIYVLFNLIGIAPMARLSDQHGRKLLYAISLLLFGIGSGIVALAHSFPLIIAGRAIQGFGASGIFPVASATVGDIFPVEKQGRALGLIGAVFGIAFIIGPVIAGVLLKYFSWNVLFMINLPVVLYLIVQSLRILPGKLVREPIKFDLPGSMLLALVLISFTLWLNPPAFMKQIEHLGAIALLVSLVSLVLLVMAEKKAAAPVVRISYLTNKQIVIAGAIATATGFLQAAFVFFPKFAIAAYSVSTSSASFMLLPLVGAVAIGSPIGGRVLDKIGPKPVITGGVILSGIGLVMISLSHSDIWLFYGAEVVIGLGMAILAGSSLRFVVLNETDKSERASAQGILTLFISSGQIIGSTIISALAASMSTTSGYMVAFMVVGVSMLLLIPVAMLLRNTGHTTV
ncbi:MAG TPA: MFS transporter [Williamwhitmania sp.]|nr:MFS transporter [Williamwhitmania sp.]